MKVSKNIIVLASFGLLLRPATAQVAPDKATPASDQAESAGEVVQMSQFEVTTTQGAGYVASNSARGMKTDQPLLDIPQADIVVTSDFINDTGYVNSSDVLRYVGVAAQYRGEALSQRGTRDANSYLDDFPDQSEGFQDDFIVDSYDVIKGPAAVLYQGAALSGVIIKSTKKPLPYEQAIITESVQEWGQSRTTVDYNVPLGQIGDTKLAFRFLGVVQVGNEYWENTSDHRVVLHPELSVDYKNTTLRLAYDFENLFTAAEPQSLMNLRGGLWTGWGRDYNGLPPGDSSAVENQHQAVRLELLTKISDSWENRIQAEWNHLIYYGSFIQSTQSVDWVHDTETYRAVLYNLPLDDWMVMDDATGKYLLGPIIGQSTTGFAITDNLGKSEAFTGVNFGTNDSVTVPINSRGAINALQIPSVNAYSVPANPGSRGKTFIETLYYQQELDFLDNRISLVGGFTFESIETITDGNLAANAPSYTATDANGSQWLHRFGAVVHATKDIALYALTSTTFSPGGGPTYTNGRLPNVIGQGNEVRAQNRAARRPHLIAVCGLPCGLVQPADHRAGIQCHWRGLLYSDRHHHLQGCRWRHRTGHYPGLATDCDRLCRQRKKPSRCLGHQRHLRQFLELIHPL